MVIKPKAVVAAAIRAIVRFFTPSVSSITRDFERKIAQLNRIVDQINEDMRQEQVTREVLRERLFDSYDNESRMIDEACRVSAIRTNLENIIRA